MFTHELHFSCVRWWLSRLTSYLSYRLRWRSKHHLQRRQHPLQLLGLQCQQGQGTSLQRSLQQWPLPMQRKQSRAFSQAAVSLAVPALPQPCQLGAQHPMKRAVAHSWHQHMRLAGAPDRSCRMQPTVCRHKGSAHFCTCNTSKAWYAQALCMRTWST